MQLTFEVREALERARKHNGSPETTSDMALVFNEMLRLFPPGCHDEITPERLVEAGFVDAYADRSTYRWTNDRYTVDCYPYGEERGAWTVTGREYPHARSELRGPMMPRNMGKVLELVALCKGGE